jgi:hypothetical protein
MKTSICRSKSARKAKSPSKPAIGRYLAAGFGVTGLATVESEAAIVNLDVSSISGVNGGLSPGGVTNFTGFVPATPGTGFTVYNAFGSYSQRGVTQLSRVRFAAGPALASPTKFVAGNLVSSANSFPSSYYQSVFSTTYGAGGVSPNFGPGSYLGFRIQDQFVPTNFYYGYLETTWNSTTNQFQILSGAYENTPNTAITVPEPSAIALTGIGALALGAGAIRRSRKARKAAAEGTLAEAV